jgi:hypothetical protein
MQVRSVAALGHTRGAQSSQRRVKARFEIDKQPINRRIDHFCRYSLTSRTTSLDLKALSVPLPVEKFLLPIEYSYTEMQFAKSRRAVELGRQARPEMELLTRDHIMLGIEEFYW